MASTPQTSTVIAIDIRRGALHYYSMLGDDKASIVHLVKNYAGESFTEEFYAKLKDAIAGFVADQPSEAVRKISVILPDEAVTLDTVRIPVLRSAKQQQNALNVKISDIYRNHDDLKILTHMAEKNKQYCTYNIAALQKGIITSISAACAENKLLVDSLSYSSASVVAAVSTLNPKLKNENYLFLDIKDIYSRFVFVVGGRAVGFYSLPFGLEYLESAKVVGEDMLFDHRLGEMTVINAKEKAKSKKLTMMKELNASAEAANPESALVLNTDDSSPEAQSPDSEARQAQEASHVEKDDGRSAFKKTPRKLPAYMQRPIPESAEGVVKENFRVFVKWALTLIASNPAITAIGAPKFVSVNLPAQYGFVIDALASEEKEMGISFVRFASADGNDDLSHNLELFGGINTNNWHYSADFLGTGPKSWLSSLSLGNLNFNFNIKLKLPGKKS